MDTVSSKRVADIVHWLYFDYYHSIYGIPKAEVRSLFQRTAQSLLGRIPTEEEISHRSVFAESTPDIELTLRKIKDMVI